MSSRDGNLWIVFNGAIYNHVELAAELRAEGHGFVSRTDTEVLLHLYGRGSARSASTDSTACSRSPSGTRVSAPYRPS